MHNTEHLVEGDVVWCDPADPGEVAESLEEIPWDNVPRSRSEEAVEEEPLTAYTAAVTNTGIGLCVEGVEESASNQVGRPDWGGRSANGSDNWQQDAYSWMGAAPRSDGRYLQLRNR